MIEKLSSCIRNYVPKMSALNLMASSHLCRRCRAAPHTYDALGALPVAESRVGELRLQLPLVLDLLLPTTTAPYRD